ncbi:MAG: hypothetical protein DCC75_04860 [Proteobacteria bacterium]|nr:MAG: hypothetical protein DCC75_04860 [Pseudomonadota bacterium]
MDGATLIGILALVVALFSAGFLAYYFLFPKKQTSYRSLMASGSSGLRVASSNRAKLQNDESGREYERLKKATKKRVKTKPKVTLQEKFFHAGIFTDREKRDFFRLRFILPFVTGPVVGIGLASISTKLAILGFILGVLVGLQLPFSLLDRRIKRRDEEIMFYLPLVIEQIVIGVSSSLDIGPCVQRVIMMADERDSHNVVSELLRHVQMYAKSGVSLEEAFSEVGKLSGHTELKHTFMSLAQVSKHGGEITRQLQELADAVASQRETRIEAKIKKLELEATGPVGLVFVGFMIILLIGFGTPIIQAFK